MSKVIIIGNSSAGFSACETLVKNNSGHTVTVISQEEYPAYKSNLLLDYLSGSLKESDLFLCELDFYARSNVNFLKNCQVVRIDAKKQRVILKDNSKLEYDYLIIASGQRIEFPDIPGRGKDGVIGFYTLQDSKQIKDKIMIAQTICIIGQGETALKLAEVLSLKDKEVKIISAAAIDNFNPSEKIELVSGFGPQEFIGEGAELQAVKLNSGKVIGTNLAIFVGNYVPACGFLKETDIRTNEEGYIMVDNNMRTNLENIFACGSVCRNETISIKDKSWEQAANEGVLAAQNLILQ